MTKPPESTPPSWDSLLQTARHREAPAIDVSFAVLAQLRQEQEQVEEPGFLAMLGSLAFSRRGQFTYAMAALILVFSGVIAWMEHSKQVNPDNDHVVAFIQNGDWSDWL
jgi:hypothetical protein